MVIGIGTGLVAALIAVGATLWGTRVRFVSPARRDGPDRRRDSLGRGKRPSGGPPTGGAILPQNVGGEIRRDPRWSGVGACRGAGEGAFDQQHDAFGVVRRIGMPEPLQLVLDQSVQARAVFAGDGMHRVLRIL